MIFGLKSKVITQFLVAVFLLFAAYSQDHRVVIIFCAFASGVCFAGMVEDFRKWRRLRP